MTLRVDFLGCRYDDAHPSFIVMENPHPQEADGDDKFVYHRPTKRLLDRTPLLTAMSLAGYTPPSYEYGYDDVWMDEFSGFTTAPEFMFGYVTSYGNLSGDQWGLQAKITGGPATYAQWVYMDHPSTYGVPVTTPIAAGNALGFMIEPGDTVADFKDKAVAAWQLQSADGAYTIKATWSTSSGGYLSIKSTYPPIIDKNIPLYQETVANVKGVAFELDWPKLLLPQFTATTFGFGKTTFGVTITGGPLYLAPYGKNWNSYSNSYQLSLDGVNIVDYFNATWVSALTGMSAEMFCGAQAYYSNGRQSNGKLFNMTSWAVGNRIYVQGTAVANGAPAILVSGPGLTIN